MPAPARKNNRIKLKPRPAQPKARKPKAKPRAPKQNRPKMQRPAQKAMPKPKKTIDPALTRLLRCIVDPFTGPLSTALVPGGPSTTALCRRLSQFAISVTSSALGTDCFIPLNTARDPYMVLATGNGADWTTVAPTLSYFNRATDTPLNYTIPLGASARVISSGVRLECTSGFQDMSGMLYHFPYNPDKVNTADQVPSPWGSPSTNLAMAAGHHRICANTCTFVEAPNISFLPVQSYPDASWTTGLPDITEQVDGIRLFMTGIKTGVTLNFLVTVAEVVEYYHVTHKHFSRTPTTHMEAPAMLEALRVAMAQPGSNASSPSSPDFIQRIGRSITSALGTAINVGAFVAQNREGISTAFSTLQDGLSFLL